MMEEILTLASGLCGGNFNEALLAALCEASEVYLRKQLREGVTPEQCGKAYALAVAAIAAKACMEGISPGYLKQFSAGDLTVQMDSSDDRLTYAAVRLLGPFMKDDGFAFLGV